MEKRYVSTFVVLKILEVTCHSFIATTYVPFLLSRGLSLFQATQVNIAFMFVNTLLDPLTGSLADKIGQKKTYMNGFVFVGIGSIVYGTGSSFWTFVCAECLFAIGTALWSEALESWIRILCGKEVSHKAITKAGYYSPFFSIAFGFVGSIAAAKYGLHIPWFLIYIAATLSLIVGTIITSDLPDATNHHNLNRGSIKESLKLFVGVPELRFTVIVAGVSTVAFQALNMFWSPVFKELLGSVGWLGFVWAGISIFSSIGFFLVRRMDNPGKITIGVLVLLTGVSILLPSAFFSKSVWFLLAGFLLHEVSRAGIRPLLFTYSNDFIPDEIRSTSNSLIGSSRFVGALIGLFISGLLTEYISPVNVWVVSGVILIVLSIWILISRWERC